MDFEHAITRAAEHIGASDATTADKIVRAIEGEAGHIPPIALDFAWRARRIRNPAIPVSRNEVLDILQRGAR